MLLIFSDLHLDNYRRFSTTLRDGINSRLMEQIQVVSQIIKLAQEEQPEAIIFLGDLFNGQGATINKLLYLVGFDLIYQLQQVSPVYLLVGNHDLYGSSHILSPMSHMDQVRVVESTVPERLMGRDITLVPWGGNRPTKGDVLLGHLDISEFSTGVGYSLPGTISPSEFKYFNLVVTGHWHTFQKKGNIVCCGAVMPISFGDVADEDYGCLLLKPDLTYDRRIIASPKFIPIRIDSQEDMERFMANKSDNYYKLSITDRKIVVPKTDHTVEVEWDIQEEMKSRLEYDVDTPLEDVLIQYIEKANTSIDKNLAIKILKEVTKEC